jgi:hypothetical protein
LRALTLDWTAARRLPRSPGPGVTWRAPAAGREDGGAVSTKRGVRGAPQKRRRFITGHAAGRSGN